jgi:hypothetical protein
MEAERVKKLTKKCRNLPTPQHIGGQWRLSQTYYPRERSKAHYKCSPVPYFATKADAAAKAEWWMAWVEHEFAKGGPAKAGRRDGPSRAPVRSCAAGRRGQRPVPACR